MLTEQEQQALAAALAAEHAAVYGYGLVAAFALDERAGVVAEAADVHRTRRNAVTDRLAAAGAPAPPSEAGYTVPLAVSDAVSAAQLAELVEAGCARAWRSVLERSEPGELRGTAVAALTDTAVRATGWRVALGATPATTAFPGTS